MKQIYLLTTILFLNYINSTAQTDIITGLSFPAGLAINGNELYIAEYNGDKISKIDITATTPTATDVVDVEEPWYLIIDNNILYITETTGTVSKLTLSTTLSTNDIINKKSVKIFPNPSVDYIQIQGLIKSENYRIYNVIGSEISKGSINTNEKIDVRNYSNGLYFLKFENGDTIKFLKE